MLFPKRTAAQKIGDAGVNIVSKVITKDLGMIFKEIPQEYDYGVDAYIEFVSVEGFVTGKNIGVQIKCGDSYFLDATPDGYWYAGSTAHLNYFLNSLTPIFIFLVEPNSEEVYWAHFNPNYLHKSGENWKILIPKINTLKTNFHSYMQDFCIVDDQSESVRDHLAYKDAMAKMTSGEGNSIHIGIRKESIEFCDTSGLVTYFEGLKSSKELLKKSQGKVSFFVHGYDEDPRELFEIPEIISYFKKVEPEVKYWFYFLNPDSHMESLGVLMAVACEGKKSRSVDSESFVLDFDNGAQAEFFQRNFEWLNEMTDFLGLPMKENKRISKAIIRYYKKRFIPATI